MAGNSNKPSIPAWQRAAKPNAAVGAEAAAEEKGNADKPKDEVGVDEVQDGEAPGPEESASPSSQLEMVEAFLSDPHVKDQPLEKKRAFLQSKEVPVETADKMLEPSKAAFEAKDFQSFQQQQQQPPAQPPAPRPQSQGASGPPIITYPEFLLEAHKPAPLITRDRVLNATYAVSAIAAIVYGTSKFIINPMIGNLTEARHDFHSHSQTKLDEFNERLSKLVSKVPEPKKSSIEAGLDGDKDDLESITSDPTELFHRDIGVQTSPPTSTSATPETGAAGEANKKDATTYQTDGLAILTSHLNEITERIDTYGESAKERKESMNKLRHYLDTVMYGSMANNLWASPEDAIAGSGVGGGKKDGEKDALEDLKKEIRGVKGVLLSARRFPSVGMPANVAGRQSTVGAGA